jgi:hypothetical protein
VLSLAFSIVLSANVLWFDVALMSTPSVEIVGVFGECYTMLSFLL